VRDLGWKTEITGTFGTVTKGSECQKVAESEWPCVVALQIVGNFREL
jgi:hypothetical protein